MSQEIQNTEEDYRVTPPATSDEIDLTDIVGQIWWQRRFIIKITAFFILLGLFIAIFAPVKYTAGCTVVPQSGNESKDGNLGGIAAMMGVNIGAGVGETLSPSVYPQIVKSIPFTREIMRTPITVKKSYGEEIPLYDFYTQSEYQSFNLIATIKKYTLGLPGLLIGSIRKNSDREALLVSDSLLLPTISKEEEKVYKTIHESMRLNLNQKEGYVTIDYTFPEAEATARITENIRKTLEQYVIAFKSEKAVDNLLFVEESFNDARLDFLEKQERLALFQDANRSLTTASARATEQRLRSEYDIAFTIYNELAKQLEQAKIAVKETKPLLTVIEPVVVPARKSAPRRAMILAVFTFMGFISGIGWIFAKPLLQDLVKNVQQRKE